MSRSEVKTLPWRGALGMLMLYAGKASGILVTLLFIPLYNRTLGPEQFGIVAVILSLQALLIMLDFGLSTLVSRDVATGQIASKKLWAEIRNAERALLSLYLVILSVVVAAWAWGVFGSISVVALVCSIVLFGFLVLQNLHYCIIIANRQYVRASMLQSGGNLVRAAVTAMVLSNYSSTLEAFVVVQAVFAGLQAWSTRAQSAQLYRHHPAGNLEQETYGNWPETLHLMRRSAPLALFAGAGAAVMQLDKPIISAFMTSASVGPYFLAMTLCMVPTSVLAGPVTQYFQPKVLEDPSKRHAGHVRTTVDRFTLTLLAATLVPCAIIWLLRTPLISLWLGNRYENELVANYVEILLPGVMIGALGYIPYTLLLGVQDYRFQAVLSLSLTALTLLAATWAASRQSVGAVTIIYALYHISSTTLSWGRAIYLPATRELALRSGRTALLSLLAVGLVLLLARPENSLNFI